MFWPATQQQWLELQADRHMTLELNKKNLSCLLSYGLSTHTWTESLRHHTANTAVHTHRDIPPAVRKNSKDLQNKTKLQQVTHPTD